MKMIGYIVKVAYLPHMANAVAYFVILHGALETALQPLKMRGVHSNVLLALVGLKRNATAMFVSLPAGKV